MHFLVSCMCSHLCTIYCTVCTHLLYCMYSCTVLYVLMYCTVCTHLLYCMYSFTVLYCTHVLYCMYSCTVLYVLMYCSVCTHSCTVLYVLMYCILYQKPTRIYCTVLYTYSKQYSKWFSKQLINFVQSHWPSSKIISNQKTID